jgi:septal ring factor EnvC (AmiA/AmiB activator)
MTSGNRARFAYSREHMNRLVGISIAAVAACLLAVGGANAQTDEEVELAQAEAELAEAESDLAEIESAEADLEAAEAELEVAEAEAELAEAEAELAEAEDPE